MKTSLFAMFLLGCAHTVEGTGQEPAEEKTTGETLAEGTTSPPETTPAPSSSATAKPAPTSSSSAKPAATTPPTTPAPAPPPTITLEQGYAYSAQSTWCSCERPENSWPDLKSYEDWLSSCMGPESSAKSCTAEDMQTCETALAQTCASRVLPPQCDVCVKR